MAVHCLCVRTALLQIGNVSKSCHSNLIRIPSLKTSQRLLRSRSRIAIAHFSSAQRRRQKDDIQSQLPQMPTAPAQSPSVSQTDNRMISPEEDEAKLKQSEELDEELPETSQEADDDGVRIPRSVQAIYFRPLRRKPKYGLPCCDLQIRSYSVRNLEFMADFALRAAYYLHLPARGPVPLPRRTERWTVPRSNFVHKKSQENFERITMRRLIQILDGHPETVEIWLAFLRKHAYYGVGMKANVWEHEKLGVGKTMDVSLENLRKKLEPKWAHFGRRKNLDTSEKAYQMMTSDSFKQTSDAPLSQVS
ncbi:MAG: mitochondrial 37S ribosomal protein rsm10 [Heterodermia speciosa]|uniref:Small ribosomal subunit protein uS10m n=1 Tax=Heterodermia speciosa TaxID=116794 RepID=A0A8H3IDC0_9LECA|nr:MAG: mitochondrial 37S ribosomal protein rsm10 [Heterodermia speciosa]